jgi:hypothetical protein
MSLAEIQKEALALSEKERVHLAVSLLETIPTDEEISDEEVLQRDSDLLSGRVEEISHDEFMRRVEKERDC